MATRKQLRELAARLADAVQHRVDGDAPPALVAKAVLDEVTAFANQNPGFLNAQARHVVGDLADLLEDW